MFGEVAEKNESTPVIFRGSFKDCLLSGKKVPFNFKAMC